MQYMQAESFLRSVKSPDGVGAAAYFQSGLFLRTVGKSCGVGRGSTLVVLVVLQGRWESLPD